MPQFTRHAFYPRSVERVGAGDLLRPRASLYVDRKHAFATRIVKNANRLTMTWINGKTGSPSQSEHGADPVGMVAN